MSKGRLPFVDAFPVCHIRRDYVGPDQLQLARQQPMDDARGCRCGDRGNVPDNKGVDGRYRRIRA
jgi:hypothetical protein